MSDIIQVDNIWFPPANILFHGHQKLKTETSSAKIKQINEAMSVAIMLVGISKGSGKEFRLQLVDPSEQTPDVRTMHLVEATGKPNHLQVQEVEVVTLEKNSSESVDDFIKRTKLSLKKSYPPTTVILCHINKDMVKTKSWRDIHNSLKGSTSNNDVYVLARTDPTNQKYQLVRVHPQLEIIQFDVMQELTAKPKQKVLKMRRSGTQTLEPTDEINLPF